MIMKGLLFVARNRALPHLTDHGSSQPAGKHLRAIYRQLLRRVASEKVERKSGLGVGHKRVQILVVPVLRDLHVDHSSHAQANAKGRFGLRGVVESVLVTGNGGSGRLRANRQGSQQPRTMWRCRDDCRRSQTVAGEHGTPPVFDHPQRHALLRSAHAPRIP